MPQSKEDPLTAVPAYVSVFWTGPTIDITPKADLYQSLSSSHEHSYTSSPTTVSTTHTKSTTAGMHL